MRRFILDRDGNCLDSQDISPKVPSIGDVLKFTPGGAGGGAWTPTPEGATGAIGLDVIYRPGGTAGGNVFTTWTTAWNAATSAGAGPVTIGVDDSIVTPAPVDAGGWDMGGRIMLVNANPSGSSTLNIPATAQLQNFPGGESQGSLTIQGNPTLALPSILYLTPAAALSIEGYTLFNAGTAPMVQVGAVGTPVNFQFSSLQSSLFGNIGHEIFGVAVGSTLFGSVLGTLANPPTGLIAGAGNVVWGRQDRDSTLPIADVNFTGTLAVSPQLNGPFNGVVTTPAPTGATTYIVDATYTTGARSADDIIPVKPTVGTVTTIQLPDARLPMNKGRKIRIVDANGGSGAPGVLRVTCPAANLLNGLAGGPKGLQSAWGQWDAVVDSTTVPAQWIVSELSEPTSLSLTQTTWFIDPQNTSGLANDASDGLTAGTPLRTIAQMASRLGGTEPDFGSPTFTVTVTLMSDTNSTDPWDLTPKQGTMVCVATLTNMGVGVFNAVTPRNQAAATKWQVGTASLLWAAFVNFWIQDTTVPSWFNVEADLGGGTATVTQPTVDPRSLTGVTPALAVPVNGDSFTVWKPGIVHVSTTGGLDNNSNVIMQNAELRPVNVGGQCSLYGSTILELCTAITAYVAAGAQIQSALSTLTAGQPTFLNCVLRGGCDILDGSVSSGSIWAPFVLRANWLQASYGGGLYVNATAGVQSFSGGGKQQIGDVGIFCNNLNLLGGGGGRQTNGVISSGTDGAAGSTAAIWGATSWPMKSGGIHMCKVSFTAELKVTGAITLAGLATASSFNPATGAFSPQTGGGSVGPLTAAAIDAAGPGIAVQGGGVFAPGNMCGMFKEF